MRNLKRKLAALLAAVMLISALPVGALAVEAAGGTPDADQQVTADQQAPTDPQAPATPTTPADPVVPADTVTPVDTQPPTTPVDTQTPTTPVDTQPPTTPVDTQTPTTPADPVDTQTPADQQASAGQQAPADQQTPADPVTPVTPPVQPEDDVAFNTGSMLVIVTADEDKLDSVDEEGNPLPYVLFEADGSCGIPVEPTAFFPYEVQFTYQGRTWETYFMTPEDTVEVGGHTFSLLYEGDSDSLSQIGVWIGDTYVPAYPEKKTFTNDGGMGLFSMGPLMQGEIEAVLDLSSFVRAQLKAVRVSAILGGLETSSGASLGAAGDKVAWVKGWYNDSAFEILDATTGTIDLSASSTASEIYFRMIAGTVHQLDLNNNTLYQVTVKLPLGQMFDWAVKAGPGGDSRPTTIEYGGSSDFKGLVVNLGLLPGGNAAGSVVDPTKTLYGLAMDFLPEITGKQARVYWGLYETLDALHAAEATTGLTDITGQIWGKGTGFFGIGTANGIDDFPLSAQITALLCDNTGAEIGVSCIQINVDLANIDIQPVEYVGVGGGDYGGGEGGWEEDYFSSRFSYWDGLREERVHTKQSDLTPEGKYLLSLGYYLYDDGYHVYRDTTYISRAVVGLFNSLSEAASQPDIRGELFSPGNGYPIDCGGNGTIFTIFDMWGRPHKIQIKVTIPTEQPVTERKEYSPLSADTYFQARGIDGAYYDKVYVMSYEHDSYYSNGYQTILTTDDTLDLSQLKLDFYDFANKIVVKNANGSGTTEQVSRQSVNDFSHGPVHYAAASTSGTELKNYFVTVVQKETTGPGKLFVNGINGSHGATRTIFLTDAYENRHDIFIANVGAADLTNLKVTLTDAENVKLDEYWTVGGSGNDTLAPLEISGYEALKGVAKIRLLSTGTSGTVKGKLTISADGQDDVVITLSGIAYAPEVVTGTLPDGVKYVPYGQFILTNNEYDWLKVSFNKVSGDFPQGVSLKPNGELYGTPQAAGDYSFALQLNYSVAGDFAENYNYTGDLINGYSGSSDWFSLRVLDNTSANVEASNETGYTLLDRVPDNDGAAARLFRSEGVYANYVDFWLDGRKLTEGTDYVSEDGSTKITIQGQTFSNLSAGEHTISAEFRTGGKDNLNSELKTTSQNFTITRTGGNTGNSGSSSSRPPRRENSSTKPSTPVTPQPEQPKTAAEVFTDISADQWYYHDVDWAYQKELMTGVTDRLFLPEDPISNAMVLVVLARMAEVDLSNQAVAEGIPSGRWYTAAASWAKEAGLLPEGAFDPEASASRGAMAELLLKYLAYRKVDCTLPSSPVAFTDADEMTPAQFDAFQVLYQYGIFKGIGNYTMDVSGSTTRSQFAALLHRLSVFMAAQH